MLRRIGIRAHDYGENEIDNLSKYMQNDGYTTVHLAPQKAIRQIKESNGFLDENDAKTIRNALDSRGIDISVLGCYLNYAHPDEEVRAQNIEKAKMYIRLAEEFGYRVVGTETGSLDANYKRHFANHGELAYRRFRDALQILLDYAGQYNVEFAIEAVEHHIINTPNRMKRLIDDLEASNLKVICDITNMITPNNYQEQDKLINTMFDLLEDQIQVVHIKDFDINLDDSSKSIVTLSHGKFNLELLAKRVKDSSQMIDVIAEDVKPEDIQLTQKILTNFFSSDL